MRDEDPQAMRSRSTWKVAETLVEDAEGQIEAIGKRPEGEEVRLKAEGSNNNGVVMWKGARVSE